MIICIQFLTIYVIIIKKYSKSLIADVMDLIGSIFFMVENIQEARPKKILFDVSFSRKMAGITL